ncbi:NifB/NifX family molybdenum-iron cluster-binding protein [Petroclostridium sp. X23]|uniref:NifB/NifX family molybdenum-iron cluster-binding protein n=1 Tax=Petroclostridium sp. X23 TaxID=3045146 RepID=UPI0024ADE83B|nr:NifB/NifX family molybdenum-iron cluster-binding protein [Petroclostridium sp. X23]WHH58387.1 NifB/NifX family molybdenum-iron cluster-binding protein [Petroclostridium sp. X23]
MKIAMPCSEKSIDSQVNQTFGRSPFFIIVDSDTIAYDAIENPAMNASGGAGIQAAQTIVDSGAQALITARCGQNASDVLKPAGVKLYKAIPGTVKQLVEAFKDGKLEELNDIHPGYHGER